MIVSGPTLKFISSSTAVEHIVAAKPDENIIASKATYPVFDFSTDKYRIEFILTVITEFRPGDFKPLSDDFLKGHDIAIRKIQAGNDRRGKRIVSIESFHVNRVVLRSGVTRH